MKWFLGQNSAIMNHSMVPVTNKLRALDQQMFTGKEISVNQYQEHIPDSWRTKARPVKKSSISHAMLNHFSV